MAFQPPCSIASSDRTAGHAVMLLVLGCSVNRSYPCHILAWLTSKTPSFVQANPLLLPKFYTYSKGARWHANMKYKRTGTDSFEGHEPYLERLQGYTLYFASITQSSASSNPLSIDKAWEYVARWGVLCSLTQASEPMQLPLGLSAGVPTPLHLSS